MTRVIRIVCEGYRFTALIERSNSNGKFAVEVYSDESPLMNKIWDSTISYITLESAAGAAMESVIRELETGEFDRSGRQE